MKFAPKTKEELRALSRAPDGEWDFEILDAQETTSKSGNEMIKIKLRIFTDVGEYVMFDYLLEAMMFKLLHFCEAVGMTQRYESGNLLAEDLIGRSGRCQVVTRRDKEGQYPDSSVVKDYFSSDEGYVEKTESPAPAPKYEDDNIPF